jgi:hypothetical protein
MRPPRALWVPFPLGRPLGAPNDPVFQRRVLSRLLALLEREDGPVILDDFRDDAPGAAGSPGWSCPVRVSATDLLDEVEQLRPAYERVVARAGRTTVGLSGVPIESVAEFLARYDDTPPGPNPRSDLADVLMMRFGADDLKAFYLEAATDGDTRPSGPQLEAWFWGETVAAGVLRRIWENSQDSDDASRKLLGSRCLVPERVLE